MIAADPFAHALAYAIQTVWNDQQDRFRFSGTRCARAGRIDHQAAFVCRAEVTDRRTGRVRSYRGVILADGTPVG